MAQVQKRKFHETLLPKNAEKVVNAMLFSFEKIDDTENILKLYTVTQETNIKPCLQNLDQYVSREIANTHHNQL